MPSIGKISGLCADYSQSTLNGRPYDKIYQRLVEGKDFRFNEMMKRGGIPCELGHPIDFDPNGIQRTETDPSKIAVILTKVEKGGPKSLVAEGDIRDTPNGKIFKSLSEIYNFGLSSRGSYEVEEGQQYSEGPDGWNQETYIFKGFDLVLLPANPKSVLSVTEGISSKPKTIVKVARESIDVNLISKASQVSEDQVEEALDQLFKIPENPGKSEEVSILAMKDKLNPEEEVAPEVTTEGEEPNEEQIEPTLITNGEEVDKIKADLQTALDEIKALTEGKEKDTLELSNRDAEVLKLSSDVEELKSELNERITESEQFVEKFETLKELSQKLLESYQEAKSKFDSTNEEDSVKAKADEELKEELEGTKRDRAVAQESLTRERNISTALKKELASAKESLISAYSMSLGVATEALKSSLGKAYTVSKIKPAAEALANQASRYSNLSVLSVTRSTRPSATEAFQATDDIEKELLGLVKENK